MPVRGTACNCFLIAFALVFSAAVIAYAWLHRERDDNLTRTVSSSSAGLRAVDSLKFVIIVARHGNRRSLVQFPNDPFPHYEAEHYGLGELTKFGRIQSYGLGAKIRSLYDGFLSTLYKSSEMYAMSTAKDRTLMSGMAFLAGLYPPTGYQLWNTKITWQPIPLYSNSPDVSSEAERICPKYLQLRTTYCRIFMEKNEIELTSISDYLGPHLGANLTGTGGIFFPFDVFTSMTIEGFPLPEWASLMYPHPLEHLVEDLVKHRFIATDTMTRLIVGPLLRDIIRKIKDKVNSTLTPDRKLFYYSGHDISLVGLQAALGIPTTSMRILVNPSSAIVFELHQNKISNSFFVKVLYIDGATSELESQLMMIPGCEDSCQLETFVRLTHKFANVTNYEEECMIVQKPKFL